MLYKYDYTANIIIFQAKKVSESAKKSFCIFHFLFSCDIIFPEVKEMDKRIFDLVEKSKKEDLTETSNTVEYDPFDLALPEAVLNAKRITEYILAQPVFLTDTNRFTGLLRLRGMGVPGDIFSRADHAHFNEAASHLYCRYPENLVTFEWQHSAANYERILKFGIKKCLNDIECAKELYKYDKDKYAFEEAMEIVCRGAVKWSNKCAQKHFDAAKSCTDPVRKAELEKLANAASKVPYEPATSFYEGLQTVIFCFNFLPDSIGTLDRYMYDLYRHDIDNNIITRDEAKSLLQEIFIYISNHTPPQAVARTDFSAECHFAIGGYNENGEDGFTDLSRLIVEALMELDTRRPSISLRRTNKTPFEVLRFMLDAERNDKNKRIAFANDEPRIKALENIIGIPHSEAIKYTMVGCNEPSLPGTLWKGGMTCNIVRSLTNTLKNRKAEVCAAETYEAFEKIFDEELLNDIELILEYEKKFNAIREKDINVLSCFLLDGCIESGLSATQGGCKIKLGGFNAMGLTCLIDSLTVIKQFVFDEKKVSMETLITALENNWNGYGDLRSEIIKHAKFFGNAEEISDTIARKISEKLYDILSVRRYAHGERIIIGTLAGYNPHYASFGKLTTATPDGRFDGDAFMVGTGQANGKDRNGLAALMHSIAQSDPTHIFCGPVVCNMRIEETVIRNDEQFEKFCHMVETYFRSGGIQVQLNYVSKEELLAARATPQEYGSLKVRVSGFSATYVNLDERIQDDILRRTITK